MIPIFEQGSGKGIGHDLNSFLRRFEEIFRSHQSTGRARSIALILYNFNDGQFKRVIKDLGVFVQLDRLSGRELSIFYLHSGGRDSIRRFNETLLSAIKINEEARPPCVIFFKVTEGGFTNISVVELSNADLVHGFDELYQIIDEYIKGNGAGERRPSRYVRWIRSAGEFVSIETLRAAIRSAFEHIAF